MKFVLAPAGRPFLKMQDPIHAIVTTLLERLENLLQSKTFRISAPKSIVHELQVETTHWRICRRVSGNKGEKIISKSKKTPKPTLRVVSNPGRTSVEKGKETS